MTMFYSIPWNGYKITVRPYEFWRRFFKFRSIYFPYGDGSTTSLRVFITPPKTLNTSELLKLSWDITYKEGNKDTSNTQDQKIIEVSPHKTSKPIISTNLMDMPTKYFIYFTLSDLKNEIKTTTRFRIGYLSVKDKWDMGIILLPITVSIIALIISVISIFHK